MNNKGFTLVELLAMMVLLGIFMAVTIPNIVGISESNKKLSYAEDALKFKNTVEYKIRSDEDYIKPAVNGECVVVSLSHLVAEANADANPDDPDCFNPSVNVIGSDYEKGPYEGSYSPERSYVVVKKNGGEYEYYVKLLEDLSGGKYRGIKLTKDTALQGNGYLSSIEDFSSPAPSLWTGSTIISRDDLKDSISSNDGLNCNVVKAIYYSNGVRTDSDVSCLF